MPIGWRSQSREQLGGDALMKKYILIMLAILATFIAVEPASAEWVKQWMYVWRVQPDGSYAWVYVWQWVWIP